MSFYGGGEFEFVLWIAFAMYAVILYSVYLLSKKYSISFLGLSGFTDPYNQQLRYQTMLNSSNEGPGTNQDILWRNLGDY